MCGICGIVSLKGLAEDSKVELEKMAAVLSHRGPDDSGFYHDLYANLGFKRLSIIDLHTVRQPLASEDGSIQLVLNGEIYNYRELRREMQEKGHRFRSRTDSEVVVHLYQEMGEDCLKKLRGMFSFAIWDTRAKKLFLARDRFGIKPLYYYCGKDLFLFASEAKALLEHSSISPQFNAKVLPHYLTFQYVPDPETAFAGICRLNPGHYLTLDNNGLRSKRYWQINFRPTDKPLSHYIEKTRHLLQEAVRMHMISDVPRGAFLSSGVDSGAIAALLKRHEEVKTYSVGCEGGRYDELPGAAKTASFLGTRHKEIRIKAREFWNNLPHILWCQDEPTADPAAAALYFVARLAAEEVKVVLSGEGADEVFGGYDIYREPSAVAPVQTLPPFVKGLLKNISARFPAGMKGKSYLQRAATPLEQRYFGNANIFNEEEKGELLNEDLYPAGWDPPWKITAPYYQMSRGLDGTARMQHLDFFTWLPGDILAKADRMTMAHSLELRVPFLDHVLVEFATTIPLKYKLHKGMTKYVLRKAASRYLPGDVSKRPKLGFPVPVSDWIRDHFRDDLRELFHSETARLYFNAGVLDKMLGRHCRGQFDYGRKLWTAAIFLLWHEVYIEKRLTAR